jgi:hypothetical protein
MTIKLLAEHGIHKGLQRIPALSSTVVGIIKQLPLILGFD